jgi:ferric-dicitrate binding protein FerR (iron transport regulator)
MGMFSKKKALSIWNESVARAATKEAWTTGLLVLSSAALGGIAVALWNRQALQKIRAVDPENVSGSGDKSPEFFDYE